MAISVEGSWQSAGGDITLTCPAGTTLLLACYGRGRTGAYSLGSIDYNGDAMTQKINTLVSSPNGAVSEIWYLVNPDTGSDYTLNSPLVDGDNAYDRLIAIALSGTATGADPFSNTAYKTGDMDSDGGSETQAITTVSGEMIVDIVGTYRNDENTAQAVGQVEIQVGANCCTSYMTSASTSETLEWLGGSSLANGFAWSLVSVEQDSGGAPAMTSALMHRRTRRPGAVDSGV